MRYVLLALLVLFAMTTIAQAHGGVVLAPVYVAPAPTVVHVVPPPVLIRPLPPPIPSYYYLAPPPPPAFVVPRYYVQAPRVYVRPKVYVEGQPIRNFFQAITP